MEYLIKSYLLETFNLLNKDLIIQTIFKYDPIKWDILLNLIYWKILIC